MADYKDILSGTLGKLADRVKETASSSGVLDVYAQGASRAKAFGQLTKLTLELNGDHEELQRIYTEIGVPLFEQANRVSGNIRAKRAKIDELKENYGVSGQSDIDVEIGDFDDVVSATEADGMTVEIKTKDE